MQKPHRYLVFGATGMTGRHFVQKALSEGNIVRVVARDAKKIKASSPNLEVHTGDIAGPLDFDLLLEDVHFVIAMLGDAETQKTKNINLEFVKKLVSEMRTKGIRRFLYQAGAFSKPAGRRLSPMLWILKTTLSPKHFLGQHRDNEAVMKYLFYEAQDIEWMVHRAAMGLNAKSKGSLTRSHSRVNMSTFEDCADYNYRLLSDQTAIHTCDTSVYAK